MKTIITQNTDGYDIIIAFGNADAFIDPIATGKVVNKILQENPSETLKQIAAIKQEMLGYAVEGKQAMKNAKASARAGNKSETDNHYATWKAKNDQIKECQERLKPLASAFMKERGQAMKDNAIYFTTPAGEYIVTDAEAEAAKTAKEAAAAEGKLVDKDLKIIENNKGVVYWKKVDNKWNRSECLKIGEKIPKGVIVETDLSEEQKVEVIEQLEAERISKLSKSARAKELEQVQAGLRQQAINMRSALEIDGDKAALTKAQEWLVDELGKAEIKYA